MILHRCQCTWQTHFAHLRKMSFSRVASFCQSGADLYAESLATSRKGLMFSPNPFWYMCLQKHRRTRLGGGGGAAYSKYMGARGDLPPWLTKSLLWRRKNHEGNFFFMSNSKNRLHPEWGGGGELQPRGPHWDFQVGQAHLISFFACQ